MRIRQFATAVVLSLLFSSLSHCFAEVVLVTNGKSACPIVVDTEKPRSQMALAAKLAGYLKQISGATFQVQPREAGKPLPAPAIVLQGLEERDASLGVEGYKIETRDGRLVIFGNPRRGLTHGVYGFLEETLGCRWWSRDDELVPRRPTIKLEKVNIRVEPSFTIHNLYNREAQSSENDFQFKQRGVSVVGFTGGHNMYPLLTPYAKEHPEIYPLGKNGKRADNNLHFCYLAPGIADALTEALAAQVERNKGNVKDHIYFAGMGDWYGGQCQCEKCKAVYKEETWTNPDGKEIPGYTGTLLRMINKTAADLEKRYPGIKVGTFAYMSLEAPPAKTVPRENVIIRVPRLRHCTVHSAESCQGNRAYLHNIRRWNELAPGRVYIWEYGTNFSNFLLPFPCLNSMAENIRLYHKLGLAGLNIQGNYVSTGGDMTVLKNYVWSKLMWQPDRSVEEVLDEFCRGYYGPAAADVREYLSVLEGSVHEPKLIHADEFANPARQYLSPELIARLRKILETGLAKTGGSDKDPHYRRLRELMVSVDTAELWKSGPLEEQDGRLVRTDLGGYTFDRALELVKYCRDASPREWGSGRAYQLGFLKMHGGPIASLKKGAVTVKVAPVQSGRVGPILLKDKPVILQTVDQPTGGIKISLFEGKPSSTSASMVGESGIANWGASTKHFAYRKVSFDEQGSVRLSGSLRKAAGDAALGVEVSTVYPCAEDGTPPRMEWRDKSGKWLPIALSEAKPSLSMIELTAWRVKLPERGASVLDKYSKFEKGLDDLLEGDGASPAAFRAYFCKVDLDPKKKTVTTTVRVSVNNIPSQGQQTYLDREIQVTPLGR